MSFSSYRPSSHTHISYVSFVIATVSCPSIFTVSGIPHSNITSYISFPHICYIIIIYIMTSAPPYILHICHSFTHPLFLPFFFKTTYDVNSDSVWLYPVLQRTRAGIWQPYIVISHLGGAGSGLLWRTKFPHHLSVILFVRFTPHYVLHYSRKPVAIGLVWQFG